MSELHNKEYAYWAADQYFLDSNTAYVYDVESRSTQTATKSDQYDSFTRCVRMIDK